MLKYCQLYYKSNNHFHVLKLLIFHFEVVEFLGRELIVNCIKIKYCSYFMATVSRNYHKFMSITKTLLPLFIVVYRFIRLVDLSHNNLNLPDYDCVAVPGWDGMYSVINNFVEKMAEFVKVNHHSAHAVVRSSPVLKLVDDSFLTYKDEILYVLEKEVLSGYRRQCIYPPTVSVVNWNHMTSPMSWEDIHASISDKYCGCLYGSLPFITSLIAYSKLVTKNQHVSHMDIMWSALVTRNLKTIYEDSMWRLSPFLNSRWGAPWLLICSYFRTALLLVSLGQNGPRVDYLSELNQYSNGYQLGEHPILLNPGIEIHSERIYGSGVFRDSICDATLHKRGEIIAHWEQFHKDVQSVEYADFDIDHWIYRTSKTAFKPRILVDISDSYNSDTRGTCWIGTLMILQFKYFLAIQSAQDQSSATADGIGELLSIIPFGDLFQSRWAWASSFLVIRAVKNLYAKMPFSVDIKWQEIDWLLDTVRSLEPRVLESDQIKLISSIKLTGDYPANWAALLVKSGSKLSLSTPVSHENIVSMVTRSRVLDVHQDSVFMDILVVAQRWLEILSFRSNRLNPISKLIYTTLVWGRLSRYVTSFLTRAAYLEIPFMVVCIDDECMRNCRLLDIEILGANNSLLPCVRGRTTGFFNKFSVLIQLLELGIPSVMVDFDVFFFKNPTIYLQRAPAAHILVQRTYGSECLNIGAILLYKIP